ncbi:M56 family metallopeptidase [Priestia megaterium]|uniref:M56 family metallopeptidase n=1 Tax=Priestia megaterium TaxID=1404 RepID=UPI002FFEF56D
MLQLSRPYSIYIACLVSIISSFSLCFFAYHHEGQSFWDGMLMCCNSHSWEQVIKVLVILLVVLCILFIVYFVDIVQKTKQFLSTLTPYKVRGFFSQEIETFQKKYSIQINIINDKRPVAFTYGFVYPQIIISTGLIQLLDSNEIEAVLEHEYYHYRNKDPFKLSLYKCLARLFFFLPITEKILKRYVTQKELAADAFATEQVGLKPIASALYKLMTYSSPLSFSTAHFQNSDLKDVRIEFLLTGTHTRASLSKREWAVSILHLIFITVIAGCVSFLWQNISSMIL